LCECEEREEAWQIREVLRQAGIESWIEGQGSRVWDGMGNPRILVAADQFEQAREIATRPIPQTSSSNPGCKSRITSLLCVQLRAEDLFSKAQIL